jgi:DNA-binding XRE family transcriptional regulator
MTNSPSPFIDIIRWRAQAAEMRRRADDAIDSVAREKLLEAAAKYDRLVEEAERQTPPGRPSEKICSIGLLAPDVETMLRRNQIKAARLLLGWSREACARHAGISTNALGRLESGYGVPTPLILATVSSTLERVGVRAGDDGKLFLEPPQATGRADA